MADKRMAGDAPAGKERTNRGRKSNGASKATVAGARSTRRSATAQRQMTEADRLELWQQQFHQSILPDLPTIAGYHVCWLTTTNPRDAIPMRERLGYVPISKDEVPGYEYATVKTGEMAGLIMVNEMVAYKIPITLYRRYMQESHHDAPLREEQKLADTAESIRAHAASINPEARKVGFASGTQAIGKNRPQPKFNELTE